MGRLDWRSGGWGLRRVNSDVGVVGMRASLDCEGRGWLCECMGLVVGESGNEEE